MPTELTLLLAWGASFGVTYWLTPMVSRWAQRVGMVKVPGGRHQHQRTTPLLGGLSLFAGIYLVAMVLEPNFSLGLALPLALLAGLADDLIKCRGGDLPALPKLVMQVLPALVMVLTGETIGHISNPFGPGMLILPLWLDFGLTMFWLIGMTNAVNFLDGMDGLVAGLVSVASFTLLAVALAKGSAMVAVWAAAMLGAALAFLRYNFHPASIFMGDAGSNFLGFLLAGLSVSGYFKAATLAGLSAPLLALFIPVFNVVFVVIRRMRQGKSLVEAFTHADLEHFFNVLHRWSGFNPMETVLVILLAAMLLSASALGIAWSAR